MKPTAWFADIVARPDAPLDEAAVAIAAHAYPDLDAGAVLSRLDQLASLMTHANRAELCRVVFGVAGLRGNEDDYYDPDNSFINRVLERGVGIPISIAVVMIEVGRRANVPITGVNAPSHFLVRDATDGAVLDPFDRGAVVDISVADASPADTHLIVGRMLNNLRGVYVSRGDLMSLLWVLELRTLLPGAPPDVHHELTRARARLN